MTVTTRPGVIMIVKTPPAAVTKTATPGPIPARAGKIGTMIAPATIGASAGLIPRARRMTLILDPTPLPRDRVGGTRTGAPTKTARMIAGTVAITTTVVPPIARMSVVTITARAGTTGMIARTAVAALPAGGASLPCGRGCPIIPRIPRARRRNCA
jgi:hypothetical protein